MGFFRLQNFLLKSTKTNWYLKTFYPNSEHAKIGLKTVNFLIMATFMEIETSKMILKTNFAQRKFLKSFMVSKLSIFT